MLLPFPHRVQHFGGVTQIHPTTADRDRRLCIDSRVRLPLRRLRSLWRHVDLGAVRAMKAEPLFTVCGDRELPPMQRPMTRPTQQDQIVRIRPPTRRPQLHMMGMQMTRPTTPRHLTTPIPHEQRPDQGFVRHPLPTPHPQQRQLAGLPGNPATHHIPSRRPAPSFGHLDLRQRRTVIQMSMLHPVTGMDQDLRTRCEIRHRDPVMHHDGHRHHRRRHIRRHLPPQIPTPRRHHLRPLPRIAVTRLRFSVPRNTPRGW